MNTAQNTNPEGIRVADLPIVERPARRDGPWKWVAGPGLDIDDPNVQAFAYHLLASGCTWKVAMFGGDRTAVEAVDTVNKLSLGGDGRVFASTVDVRDAADSHRKREGLPHWRAVVKARRAAPEAVPATVPAPEAGPTLWLPLSARNVM